MELAHEMGDTVADARALVITCQREHESAGAFLRQVKTVQAKVADFFAPMIESAHKAHKQAIATREQVAGPLSEAERIVKARMVAYAEQAAREAERARMEAIHRQREADAAERARQEAQKLSVAERLEAAGDFDGAAHVLESPVVLPPTEAFDNLPQPAESVAGVSFRESWEIVNVDMPTLIDAIAFGKAPRLFVEANTAAIKKALTAYGAEFDFPGIEVRRVKTIAAKKY